MRFIVWVILVPSAIITLLILGYVAWRRTRPSILSRRLQRRSLADGQTQIEPVQKVNSADERTQIEPVQKVNSADERTRIKPVQKVNSADERTRIKPVQKVNSVDERTQLGRNQNDQVKLDDDRLIL